MELYHTLACPVNARLMVVGHTRRALLFPAAAGPRASSLPQRPTARKDHVLILGSRGLRVQPGLRAIRHLQLRRSRPLPGILQRLGDLGYRLLALLMHDVQVTTGFATHIQALIDVLTQLRLQRLSLLIRVSLASGHLVLHPRAAWGRPVIRGQLAFRIEPIRTRSACSSRHRVGSPSGFRRQRARFPRMEQHPPRCRPCREPIHCCCSPILSHVSTGAGREAHSRRYSSPCWAVSPTGPERASGRSAPPGPLAMWRSPGPGRRHPAAGRHPCASHPRRESHGSRMSPYYPPRPPIPGPMG